MTVSLGFVASRYLKSFALAVYLERSVPMFPFRETFSFAVRLLIVGAVVGAATFGMSKAVDRVLPDGLTRAAATYEEAAGQGDSVTIARVHEVLYTQFDKLADPDTVREVSRAFKKAIRGHKDAEMATERANLLALIPATAPQEDVTAAKAAAASYERVLAANAKAVSQVSRIKLLIKLVAATLAGAVAFLLSSFALRVKEPFEMVTWTVGKALGKVRAKMGTTEQ
jgi:hypothetical protein